MATEADGDERLEFAIRKGSVLLDVREQPGYCWNVTVTIDQHVFADEALAELIAVCQQARRRVLKEGAGHVNIHDDTCFNPHDAMGNGQRLCTCGGGFADEIIPLAELEEWAIRRALRATGGSVMQADRLLKVGRQTLYRKLAAYEGRP